MVHFVEPAFAAGSHPPLGGAALLVPQFTFSSLVAEYLDLGVAAVAAGRPHLAAGVLERVDLHVQRQSLHTLLGAAKGTVDKYRSQN